MKKLITMIGVAAAAFGLYADDTFIPKDIDLTAEKVGAYSFPEEDEMLFWNAPEGVEGTIEQEGDEGETYLKVDAESTLFRTFADFKGVTDMVPVELAPADAEEARGGIIADQLVQFSAFDNETETPTLEEDAKIAVWVKADADDESKGTLMVTTKALDSDGFQPVEVYTNYDTEKQITLANWYQLKITAIPAAIMNGGEVVPGFKIELGDDVIAAPADLFPSTTDWSDVYTPQGKDLVDKNQLFPSMIAFDAGAGANTLVGVGFKGTGSIKSIAIAGTEPFADTKTIAVTLPADVKVEAVDPGTFKDGEWTVGKDVTEGTITLTAPAGKLFKNGQDTMTYDVNDFDNDLDLTEEAAVEDAKARIGSVFYLTLQEAINVGGDIEVLDNITEDVVVGSGKVANINLGGYTLTGAGAKHVIEVVEGTLTIDNGSIVSAKWGIRNSAGNLTIGTKTVVSAQEAAVVFLKAGTTTINGGEFTSVDNFVIGGQGNDGNGGYTVVVNGGTFNGGITSTGYIACGIYACNAGTITVNDGTFNITGGCGICARAGVTTVNGGVWNVSGDATGKVGDKGVDVACDVFVEEFSDPQYPGYDPLTAGIFVPGKVNEELNPVKANKDFADADVLEEGFETKLVENWYTVVESQSEEPDPTEKDPEEIPEDKTAGEYFPNIAQNDITNANAKAVATWCQKDGVKGTVEAGGANIDPDAFLLDCANTEAAVKAEKAKFTITSITQDAEGKWVVVVADEYGEAEAYGNGFVEIVDVTSTIKGVDAENAKLFKAKLVFKQPSVE